MTRPPEFELEVAYNRHLPVGGEELHAIVSVAATGGDPAGPVAVVFIVDRSASMGLPMTGLAAAREAVAAAVDALPDGAYFAVIAGSDQAGMCYPADARLVAAGERTRAEAKRAAAAMVATGGTAIGKWLSLANTVFDTQAVAVRHAILLAGGENTHETPDQLGQVLESCRFTCDCRGLGTGWNVAELRLIADTLHGTVDLVAEPSRLPEEFVALTAKAARTVADGLVLRLVLPRVAELQFLRQVSAATPAMTGQVDEAGLRYDIGPLGPERRDFYLAIRVPPADVGVNMLAARVLLAGPDEEVLAREQITVTWIEQADATIDARVGRHAARDELAAAIQEELAALGSGARDSGALETDIARLRQVFELIRDSSSKSGRLHAGLVSDVDDVFATLPPLSRTVGLPVSGGRERQPRPAVARLRQAAELARVSADVVRLYARVIPDVDDSLVSLSPVPRRTTVGPPAPGGRERQPRPAVARLRQAAELTRDSADVVSLHARVVSDVDDVRASPRPLTRETTFVPPKGRPRPGPRRPATREPVVNTGFAQPGPHLPIVVPPDQTLAAGRRYLFWLDIGPLEPLSIEDAPAPLPVELPRGAVLTVALFGFEGGIEIDPAAAVERLPLGERAWFPVRIPSSRGVWRMRCGIYWRQVLLESRVITVHATPVSETRAGALRSTVDYRLANPADMAPLLTVPAHTASLFLNDNGDGSHALRVLATDGRELLRTDATFTEAQLSTQIRLARAALRRVAWGTDAPWRDGDGYRYATTGTLNHLTQDLTSLARNGFRLHHLLLRSLGRASDTGTYAMADRLAAALAKPGVIQVALKDSARHVVPVALLYDLPLDTNADRLTLCEDFAQAWRDGRPLAGTACFRGECRQAGGTVVCPGGFWGYRHALGLPVSSARGAALPHDLTVEGEVRLAAGLYRDFRHVDEHCRRLRELLPGVRWRLNDDRDAVLEELRTGRPDIVYFYCHGGVAGDVPYLRVGRGTSGPVITPDNLFSLRIQWPSRPLVFLNGCQTTDLEPDRAIDFVSFFVEDASACGVIGTEITVFEELAREFAEEFLRGFLTDRTPIGAAVTQARLALLSKGNPLGLSYIPYALPSIRLVAPARS